MDNVATCFKPYMVIFSPLKYTTENIKKRTQPYNLQKRNQYPILHLPYVKNISPSYYFL